ncbi:MAG: cytochrome D1 domain-containing protein [Bacteroidales bacterium]
MKKAYFGLTVMAIVAVIFVSCKKEIDNSNVVAKIDFPAAYVVNGQSNSISVIDLTKEEVARTIYLNDSSSIMHAGTMMEGGMNMGSGGNMWPHHIYMSPDKSRLALAMPGMDFSGGHNMWGDSTSTGNSGSGHNGHHGDSTSIGTGIDMNMMGRIYIIDAVTGKTLKIIQTLGMTHNAIFSPDGKEIWTALMMTGGKVQVFDAVSYQIIKTITVGQMPAEVTFSNDGTKVFVANGMSDNVTVIDAATKQVIDTIRVGDDPVGAWSGMNGMMYVDNEGGMSINMINSMNMSMMDSISLGFTPGMVAFYSKINELWVTDPDQGRVHYWMIQGSNYNHGGSFEVGWGAHAFAFNSDSSKCYVTNQEEGTVSVINVSQHKEIKKITVGLKPNGIVVR